MQTARRRQRAEAGGRPRLPQPPPIPRKKSGFQWALIKRVVICDILLHTARRFAYFLWLIQ